MKKKPTLLNEKIYLNTYNKNMYNVEKKNYIINISYVIL